MGMRSGCDVSGEKCVKTHGSWRGRLVARLRLSLLLSLAAAACAASAASVVSFQPQGEVRDATRATVVFSEPMVLLGKTDAPAPYEVACTEAGQGRWVDQRTWQYILNKPLAIGGRCDFRRNRTQRTLAGKEIYGSETSSFYAPGPWLTGSTPSQGSQIEEDQTFFLATAAPVQEATVSRAVWCEAEGVHERIGIKILAKDERERVLAEVKDQLSGKPPNLAVQCASHLPAGAKVRLVWGAGIQGVSGGVTKQAQSLHFTVRAPFTASFSCERERANAPCSPLSALRLSFSDNIPRKLAEKIRLKTPDGERKPYSERGERTTEVDSIEFRAPFPQSAELKLELPRDLVDVSGRSLSNASSFPLKLRTGSLPALAKFPGDFGILELKEGGVLPVTLRNIETRVPLRIGQVGNLAVPARQLREMRVSGDADVIATLRALQKFEDQEGPVEKVRNAEGEMEERRDFRYARQLSFFDKQRQPGFAGKVESRELPRPGSNETFEVLGIPLTKPGLHVVELESKLLGTSLLGIAKPMYVRTAVLVTNLAVHFKRGRDNALVWVTQLDSGKPAAGAEVQVSDCNGTPLWSGKADGKGVARIPRGFPEGAVSCDSSPYAYLASARLGEDYSFAFSDWSQGIEPWRFRVPEMYGETDIKLHTLLDRNLFRAGETVSMKHIARLPTQKGFALPDPAKLPKTMQIQLLGAEETYTVPLTWDRLGIATAQWKIPEGARLGNYEIALQGGEYGSQGYAAFRVSEFRLPLFRGSVQAEKPRLIRPSEIPLNLQLAFLNGGGASAQQVQITGLMQPFSPNFARYSGFSFSYPTDLDEGEEAANLESRLLADKQKVQLDKQGSGRTSLKLTEKVDQPQKVRTEMTFADPSGEIQTISGSLEVWPAAVIPGIRVQDWVSVQKGGKFEVVVLNQDGQPVADTRVTVKGKRRIEYSHRKRIVGGFYSYENHTEFNDLGQVCTGRTDGRGILECAVKLSDPGNIYLIAEVKDKDGNLATSGTSFWLSGDSDNWFEAGDQDRIDVIPERPAYKPGEVARFQVRTPFRDATALVTVEREGIIESFVQPLVRSNPVLEVPIQPEWGPNVYVSVLVVRGRLTPLGWQSFVDWGWKTPLDWFEEWWNDPKPTALADLSKPAFKMGIAGIEVGTEAFALKVEVSSDKPVYQVRDKAVVTLKVTTPDGKPAPVGTEVALAAVDQALLELSPNDTWKLFEAMLDKRGYGVETATGQLQVIGKRHYGKKAVPSGGSGGRAPARELFDTLLLWQPRVTVGADGLARVEVPLNDALTEFRIAAIANSEARFGLGQTTFRSAQDLQLISGLPPLVREQDNYRALLTLKNATGRSMTVQVRATAGKQSLPEQTVALPANSAGEVVWEMQVPELAAATGKVDWDIEANELNAAGKPARDRLRLSQKIDPLVPVTAQQATILRIDGPQSLPAALPNGALPGRGGIAVDLHAKLGQRPEGLRRFFEEYPFSCLEQRTSKAIGLNDLKLWGQLGNQLPSYLDSDGFARYFPGEGDGSEVLTTYVLLVAREAGYAFPDGVERRMEEALAGFVEGRKQRKSWTLREDLTERKLAAIYALARRERAKASWLSSLTIKPEALTTTALLDWYGTLKALKDIPERGSRLQAAEAQLKARLVYSGARLGFARENETPWWRMSSADSDAFRLIYQVAEEAGWQDELPRLMAGALQRQKRGHWQTTTANVWAILAMQRFGGLFEKEAVTGTTRGQLGSASATHVWKESTPTGRLFLNWPGNGNGKAASSAALASAGSVAPAVSPVSSTAVAPGNVATTTGAVSAAPPVATTNRLTLSHEGSGKPWAFMQVLAAQPVRTAVASGLRVTRTLTPVQGKAGDWQRGDIVRVRVEVESQQPLNWVVINDPIPAGAAVLGDGGGRDSAVATQGERQEGAAWPAFTERGFAGVRSYYEYVPKGKFSLEYTMRLNNAGEFGLPNTRVEAMYAPEYFAEVPNPRLKVRAAQ